MRTSCKFHMHAFSALVVMYKNDEPLLCMYTIKVFLVLWEYSRNADQTKH